MNLNLRHRCYEYQSVGKIIYDPKRTGKPQPWSAIIEVEQDLADYYRLQFLLEYKVSLVKPSWKAHISLIRGQDEYTHLVEKFWGEDNEKLIEFNYGSEFFWNEHFVWINTYSEDFFRIREKMGLAYTHDDNESWGHITIGKFRREGQMGNFTDYTYLQK